MSGRVQRLGGRIPETVVLHIDPAAVAELRRTFIERVEAILPHLNWRTHFFIVPERLSREMSFSQQIIDALSRFLVEKQFVTFQVHPVIRVGPPERTDSARWQEMLQCVQSFQRRAYEQQGEARLSILPIIEPAPGTDDLHWIRAARFFRARSATPSVVVRGPDALGKARRAAGQEIRFYVEPDEQSGPRGLVRQLWMNSVFEDLLERVRGAAEGADLLLPCRPHRVIDQPSDEVYSCLHAWNLGRPVGTLEEISESGAGVTEELSPDACAGCISRSSCRMTDNLIANDNRAEGQKVHFQLALAFSGSGRHREAIEHAVRARDLASSRADRAGASTIEGLSHLGLQEFEEAERALEEASGSADDPGLVSFHRGRVQFEWRDYIEALDRFEEALASGSKAVPEVDLLYYMVVSHLNIQEYPEARVHLDRWEKTGQSRATMLYYRGLCDIGQAKFESALSQLRACQAAGPAREDMGNVLFYTGVCLKELGRHGEAISVLERAARFDPDEVAVLNLLGFCLYKTARHREAVDCFERAIELDPSSAIDYANLAVNLRELGRTGEAIAMYRKALSLDPEIGFARDGLRRLTGEADGQG